MVKGLLGEFATLLGVLMLIWGIMTSVLFGCIIAPTIAGEGRIGVWVIPGIMATLFGFLLCWAGWKLQRSEKK